MTKWHKGPPPEIGWWPASKRKDDQAIRWWNGEFWSISLTPDRSAEYAGTIATIGSIVATSDILWTERWWLK